MSQTENNKNSPFEVRDNCLYVTTTSKRGSSTMKLCNFVPRIVSEKTVDDGAVVEKSLVLSGVHADGSTLPKVEVTGAELSNFNWLLDKWGAKCIIEVGQSRKDHLRYYIQTTAEEAEQSTEYHVTGWKKINGEWHFLLPTTTQQKACHSEEGDQARRGNPLPPATGRNDRGIATVADTRVEHACSLPRNDNDTSPLLNVVLNGKLQRYRGADVDDLYDLIDAYNLYEKPPVSSLIIHPLIAFAFLTPLNEFLKQAGCMPKFVLFITGRTGTRKSTIAALILSFFGQFTSSDLPMSFRDTANSIIANAFTLKDVLTCIDDFYPSDNTEMKKLNATAQTVMRAYGDRTGRARLRSDSTLMESRPPQGNAIITGELSPDVGESGTARYFSLELKEEDVDLGSLSVCQSEAADGAYRRTMYAYTEWLKRRYLCDDSHVEKLRDKLLNWHKTFRNDYYHHNQICHGRLPETVACLMIGMRFFLQFMAENAVINQEDQEVELELFRKELYALADLQSDSVEQVEQDKPANIFIRKLYALIESGVIVLKRKGEPGEYTPSFHSGLEDDTYLMIHPDSVHRQVKKLCSDAGEAFPFTMRAIMKALVEEGIVEPGKDTTTRVTKVDKSTLRLLFLRKDRTEPIAGVNVGAEIVC